MHFNYTRSERSNTELRSVTIEPNFMPHAHGSCLIKVGNTHLACSATVEQQVPKFLYRSGKGWVTAEYGMLPCSTGTRLQREITKGKPDGRTQEIQRLIGRSLRSVMNFELLGERQIIVDCDVIRADGGTRTAAITGGYVAMYLACKKLIADRVIRQMPITAMVAATSCGIVNGQAMLDLQYIEDSQAEVDANFVLRDDLRFIEVQMTAEGQAFTDEQLAQLKNLAVEGTKELFKLQRLTLGIA